MDGVWVVRLNFDEYQIVAICRDEESANRWVEKEILDLNSMLSSFYNDDGTPGQHLGSVREDYSVYFRLFNEVEDATRSSTL